MQVIFCKKCGFEYPIGSVGKPVCPRCQERLFIESVIPPKEIKYTAKTDIKKGDVCYLGINVE